MFKFFLGSLVTTVCWLYYYNYHVSESDREIMIAQNEVMLIPKLHMQFAEFLQHSSLKRLSILYLSTCVGLGYGLYGGAISWNRFEAHPIQ